MLLKNEQWVGSWYYCLIILVPLGETNLEFYENMDLSNMTSGQTIGDNNHSNVPQGMSYLQGMSYSRNQKITILLRFSVAAYVGH